MGIRFGPIDPLQLSFEILNKLMQKGMLSEKDAREIIKSSLDPNMTEQEKEEFVNSLMVKR